MCLGTCDWWKQACEEFQLQTVELTLLNVSLNFKRGLGNLPYFKTFFYLTKSLKTFDKQTDIIMCKSWSSTRFFGIPFVFVKQH